MFWLGLIITIIASLLSLSLVRSSIREFYPSLSDLCFDKIRLTLFIIGWSTLVLNHLVDESVKKSTQTKLQQMEKQEVLRPWAMVLPSGDSSRDIFGRDLKPASDTVHEIFQKVFVPNKEKGTVSHGGKRCDEDAYVANVKNLIERYPKLPYGRAVLAHCLKWRKDTSWKREAEQAKQQLEELIAIRPHVVMLDMMYASIIDELGLDRKKALEGAGYVKEGKDRSYIIDAPPGQ